MIDLFSDQTDLSKPPFLRCVQPETSNAKSVAALCAQRGVGFYDLDLKGVHSREDIMDVFATQMKFPSYFGKNWDAVIELATDLTWDRHPAYIALIENADSLLDVPQQLLSVFVNVCKAISLQWQEDEDEYGKPVTPVSFHFLFVGSNRFCRQLEPYLATAQPQF